MKPHQKRQTLIASEKLYQMLLIAYPASFRHEYGSDLTQVFRDSNHDALHMGGLGAVVSLWLHTSWDLITTAASQRFAQLQSNRKPSAMPDPFDRQLGSTMQSMAVLLRGGYNVLQCFDLLAQRSPEPTASTFQTVVEAIKSGTPMLDALHKLQTEVASPHFNLVIDTLLKQFNEGGNLADRLEPVAATIIDTAGSDADAEATFRQFQQFIA
ncbi:MAG: type II secretion system F family protein [Anaerolineae bacterium]|nr:type II secretion system F family protein [Anaerolineae bacterium]